VAEAGACGSDLHRQRREQGTEGVERAVGRESSGWEVKRFGKESKRTTRLYIA
jgi:threonine dehydrogenase-like Zn-dependent dehydrogenase